MPYLTAFPKDDYKKICALGPRKKSFFFIIFFKEVYSEAVSIFKCVRKHTTELLFALATNMNNCVLVIEIVLKYFVYCIFLCTLCSYLYAPRYVSISAWYRKPRKLILDDAFELSHLNAGTHQLNVC